MKGWTSRFSYIPYWLMPQKAHPFGGVHDNISLPQKGYNNKNPMNSHLNLLLKFLRTETHQNLTKKKSSFRSSRVYTIKSSVHIFPLKQSPKINQPNQPIDFWSLETAFPHPHGPGARRLMFSRLRFHSNDGDLHLRFDGLSGTHAKQRGGFRVSFPPLFWEGWGRVIWICLEKIGLDVGNFQRSKLHVSGHFCRTRWFDQASVLKNQLARISMSLCHVPLCISHFFLNKSLDPTIKWRVKFKPFQILNLWGALKDLYDNFSHKSFDSGIYMEVPVHSTGLYPQYIPFISRWNNPSTN